jgi:ABC-type sugar transport system ATPase subunit
MNLIPGTLAEGGAVLAGEDGTRVRLPRPFAGMSNRKVLLGVRPEQLDLAPPGAALLEPDIDFIELLGSDSLVYGHLGAGKQGARVAARLHTSIVAKQGRLPLTFRAEHAHFFDPTSGQRLEV